MTPETVQGGFTLIELVVVIALLALVAAVAAPTAGRLFDLSAPAGDAARLATALRKARMAAIAEGRVHHVLIDPARREWHDGGGTVTFSGLATITAVVPPAGQRANGAADFIFLPDGSATGGRIVLGDGQRRQSIAVDWLTGRVAIAGP